MKTTEEHVLMPANHSTRACKSFLYIFATLLAFFIAGNCAYAVEGSVPLPDVTNHRITQQELDGLTREQLWIVRNEIFAGNGYDFSKTSLEAHFDNQPWYHPIAGFKDPKPEEMSTLEHDNLWMIMFTEGRLAYKAGEFEKAAKFFAHPAQHDQVAAINYLGMMSEKGLGMPQDSQLAVQQYWRATKLGDNWSANRLGILFEEGFGDTQDRLSAAKFYGIAAARDSQEGQINLDRILSESPELHGPFMAWFKPAEQRKASQFDQATKPTRQSISSDAGPDWSDVAVRTAVIIGVGWALKQVYDGIVGDSDSDFEAAGQTDDSNLERSNYSDPLGTGSFGTGSPAR
ncbi:MAG: YARHG domain-containing protein [Methylococcales bacterium]